MAAPSTPYLPGWTFVDLGPDGGPYDELNHPKGCLHTTEGTSIAGAESAYKGFPPHGVYDWRSREGHQHVRLDRHSLSFKGAESDDEFVVQIELVGFAGDTHTWPDEAYRNIGVDVIAPLRAIFGIPDHWCRFYRADEGIVLATPDSPIRFTDSGFRNYSGWVGHQHVPAPDAHWDPGGFLMDKAMYYSREDGFLMALSEHEQNVMRDQLAMLVSGRAGVWDEGELFRWEQDWRDKVDARLSNLETKLADLAGRPVPEAAQVPQPFQVQVVQVDPEGGAR